MAPNRFIPYEMKSSLIRVYSYKGKNLRGTLYNPFFPEEQYFDNLIQLLFLMETVLDTLNFPQRCMEPRVFGHPEGAWGSRLHPSPQSLGGKPVLVTFKISVRFRQNASWQGCLLWLEHKAEARFRSVLELIGLIDSALSVWE